MGIRQTEQTKIREMPSRTDQNMGFVQTEQTEIWVLNRTHRPKNGF